MLDIAGRPRSLLLRQALGLGKTRAPPMPLGKLFSVFLFSLFVFCLNIVIKNHVQIIILSEWNPGGLEHMTVSFMSLA
jgi:hypothetical protein